MVNAFHVMSTTADRQGLLDIIGEMREGDRLPISLAEGDSLVVSVEKVEGGWSVEESITIETPEETLTSILGFFGEYEVD